MNPIVSAMLRPLTIMVLVAGMVMASWLAVRRMPVDISPDLNLPVIYVAQPYGGMLPPEMEGNLTYYYEYHFLYIAGIHHVESKNIQGIALRGQTSRSPKQSRPRPRPAWTWRRLMPTPPSSNGNGLPTCSTTWS
jgi:hypothetical protein